MAENGAIYISGYNGLVGSVLIQELKYRNYKNIITTSFQSLDLRDQAAVDSFFKKEHPEWTPCLIQYSVVIAPIMAII